MAIKETELQKKLSELQDKYKGEKKLAGAKSIYLASPWWKDKQQDLLLRAYEEPVQLKIRRNFQNQSVGYIHVPLLNQYNGEAFSGDAMSYEWATQTYKADLEAIKNSDLTVMLETVDEIDPGSSVELGLTVGMNKPVVSVFSGDTDAYPVNLMESFGVTSYVNSPEELTNFNFLSIATRAYEGKII